AVAPGVRTGRAPRPADHAGAEVRDDVAVEVRAAEDVVLLGPEHELHAHVVDDAVLELDVAVALGDLARDGEEQAVGVFHDVRLVHGRDLATAVAPCVVEGKLHDAFAAADRYRLD